MIDPKELKCAKLRAQNADAMPHAPGECDACDELRDFLYENALELIEAYEDCRRLEPK